MDRILIGGLVYTRGYRSVDAETGLWVCCRGLCLRGLGAVPGNPGPGDLGGRGRPGSEAM